MLALSKGPMSSPSGKRNGSALPGWGFGGAGHYHLEFTQDGFERLAGYGERYLGGV